MKLNIQLFGGRGASYKKTNYIVVSNNDGSSKIVEEVSGKIINNNVPSNQAFRETGLLNTKKTTLKDLGYENETKTKKAVPKPKGVVTFGDYAEAVEKGDTKTMIRFNKQVIKNLKKTIEETGNKDYYSQIENLQRRNKELRKQGLKYK